MRIVPFLIFFTLTIVVVVILSIPLGNMPALGKFLSPQHGFWVNAEPVKKDFNEDLNFRLKNKVEVYFDDRLVPHVFAQNDRAYFVQGFIHAKFRLWQMDFQTTVAAGRLSAVLGKGENDGVLNMTAYASVGNGFKCRSCGCRNGEESRYKVCRRCLYRWGNAFLDQSRSPISQSSLNF